MDQIDIIQGTLAKSFGVIGGILLVKNLLSTLSEALLQGLYLQLLLPRVLLREHILQLDILSFQIKKRN